MSSIMRARSALTGRWEGWEVIGGSSLELKVAGPSMLAIGRPDRHALLFTRSPSLPRMHRPRRSLLPRERVRSRVESGHPVWCENEMKRFAPLANIYGGLNTW